MPEQLTVSEDSLREAPVREDLVNTAIKFLENPNVIKTSLAEQQRFLKRKGLTDKEIRAACEKSGAYAYQEQRSRAPPLPPSTHMYPYSQPGVVQITLFERIREFVHDMTIFSFAAYIVYKFYEKFIAPFLFGKKKKTITESIEDLDKNMKQSVNELQNNLISVKVEVDKISQGADSSTQRQLSDLKFEIATVKGLLLSRNQFPPVSKSSVVRPSIPAWQKTSISQDSDSDPERKAEDLLEIGSGSGSEQEHNAKNSDSSLDIISFSSKDSDFRRHKPKHDDDDDEDKD